MTGAHSVKSRRGQSITKPYCMCSAAAMRKAAVTRNSNPSYYYGIQPKTRLALQHGTWDCGEKAVVALLVWSGLAKVRLPGGYRVGNSGIHVPR